MDILNVIRDFCEKIELFEKLNPDTIVMIVFAVFAVFPAICFYFYSKVASNKALRQFAKSNNLHFWHLSGIEGDFRSYRLSIRNEDIDKERCTIFELRRNKKFNHFQKRQTVRDIMSRFWAIYSRIKSENLLDIKSEMISFQSELIKNTDEFLPIIEQLIELIEICHDVRKIGSEAIAPLLRARKNKQFIWQIIKDITGETKLRIKPKMSLLLCKKCLTFCSSHKVTLRLSFELTKRKYYYYGCRICRQSRDFIEGRSIAVIDNLMTQDRITYKFRQHTQHTNRKWSVLQNEISVNWLAFRKPFDFHEVRIVQASDREVEEFLMQVGNDTDEFRQSRYKGMPCIVTSGCKLSGNTFRILKHTFKIEGRPMAILDKLMTEEVWVRKNEFWVNWLIYRKPFDFHEVRIMQVSDRDVEEFVMQVGNDTDELRQSRYKEIPCIIISGCKLSENTLRILRYTFKSVKEMPLWSVPFVLKPK